MTINFSKLFSFLGKFGGLAVAAYGVNVNSIKDMTVGSAVAAVVHFIDSTWNSPKGTHPSP